IQWLDLVLLAMAMAALGLRTQVGAIRQAGARPLMLALLLFVFLIAGGWVVNGVVTRIGVSWIG
ncbi:MAG: putative sulfate exporter family transporter, partial [Luteimonas sp.]|nr:putative sulfate exporter family transporter [Luteimonas sp.]